jgi:tol-pal system protein YbgF
MPHGGLPDPSPRHVSTPGALQPMLGMPVFMSFRSFGSLRNLGLAGVLALLGAGCASMRAENKAGADSARTLEALRTENAAYAKRVEELENQVFILKGELEARRAGDPPPPAAVVMPALPEVKLTPGQRPPEPEAGDPPQTLVEDAPIEYTGAAAERAGKRPMLRLWGAGAGEGGASGENAPTSARAPLRPAAAAASDEPETGNRTGAGDPGMTMYKAALDHLRGARHDQAVAAFRAFVKQHPGHDYADNAQYWLGECFYDRKDYSLALREFRLVAQRFPHGNKVPDALLKVAFSYLALGSPRPARETLIEITRNFPQHPASGLATAKLAELDGNAPVVTTRKESP